MDINEIINILDKNSLIESEDDIFKKNECLLVKIVYTFDNEELKSAKSYANEECDLGEDSTEWQEDFYYEYLKDIANDNVQEIIEEIAEELDIVSEIRSKEDSISDGQFTCLAIFGSEYLDIEIEQVLNDYL